MNSLINPSVGLPEELHPDLIRILAPNPSPMTFQGTNTYILGKKELIKYVILDGKEVDLTPAPERIKDPDGWRISSYSGKILKKKKS